jgi:DGQHR domain-containing protein
MNRSLPLDPSLIDFEFACIRALQPIGEIYVGSIPYKRLASITHFDVRRVLRDERDFERYLGIQRPLDAKRVEKIKEYVCYKDASFPTSIILALEEDYVSFDETRNVMRVANYRDGETAPSINLGEIARVLDGQHRIAGLDGYKGDHFDLSVTLFVGADLADQAQIFATVNLEQTKVNRSLVYDLFELAHSRSPQKTCHNIAVTLDGDIDSPFYKRIKRLGLATDGRVFEPIAQATFVECLMTYISSNPKADRDRLLRGGKLNKISAEEASGLPLRNLFADERDIEIAMIINNYFQAVRRKWPDAWEERGRGFILNRTNGFKALMRLFRIAYLNIAAPGDVPTVDKFYNYVFSAINLEDWQLTTDNFPPGTSGESKLYRVLKREEQL